MYDDDGYEGQKQATCRVQCAGCVKLRMFTIRPITRLPYSAGIGTAAVRSTTSGRRRKSSFPHRPCQNSQVCCSVRPKSIASFFSPYLKVRGRKGHKIYQEACPGEENHARRDERGPNRLLGNVTYRICERGL